MAEQWVKYLAIAIAIGVVAIIIALPAVSFRKLETDEGKEFLEAFIFITEELFKSFRLFTLHFLARDLELVRFVLLYFTATRTHS